MHFKVILFEVVLEHNVEKFDFFVKEFYSFFIAEN